MSQRPTPNYTLKVVSYAISLDLLLWPEYFTLPVSSIAVTSHICMQARARKRERRGSFAEVSALLAPFGLSTTGT